MKTAVVFYADILGFTEMVSLKDNAKSSKTFEKLKNAIDTIDSTMIELQQQELNKQNLKDIITYRMFSDSFYLSVSYDAESPEGLNRAIWLTFYIARVYQNLMLSAQILIRGGISKGLDYNDKKFTFSPALIKAFTLESTIATYPRIVIDNEIIADLKTAKKQTRIFSKSSKEEHNRTIIYDWSETYFLNPFIMMQLAEEIGDVSDVVISLLGYGLTMGELVKFFAEEQKQLKQSGKKSELDKNLWIERLFYWVGFEDKQQRPPSLIEFAYLSLN